MSDSAPQRAPVQVGRFVLFKTLKKGGMARVFLAVDPAEPQRLLAVKTLLPELVKDRAYREMFATEGKVGLRLQHPSIVRTVEAMADQGTAFIAMELILGHDLSTLIRRLRRQGDVMPLALAVGLARDVAAGLCHAHELLDEHGQPLNIVNRDVSPGNIMIGFDGAVKLIDFGIAQTTIDVKNQIGTIKGKLSYMSPEQVRGLPVDARSDVFSLGTVLYEMLTGVHVFHDEGDFATMERVRRAECPPASAHNPAVDAELDDILQRAMARELSMRFSTSRDLWRALKEYLAGRGLTPTQADVAAYLRTVFGAEVDQLVRDVHQARDEALRGDASAPPAPAAPEVAPAAPAAPMSGDRAARNAPTEGAESPEETTGAHLHRPLHVYGLWAAAITLGFVLAGVTIWFLENR